MSSRKPKARTLVPRAAGSAVAVLLAAAALAGTARAAGAASVPGTGRAHHIPRLAVAGTISTVAGNVGGPGRATNVSVPACGVAFGGGLVRVADGARVRLVNAQNGR